MVIGHKPGPLILDTFQKLARLNDLNDYGTVSLALEPLTGIAREKECHVMLIHHSNKAASRGDKDSIEGVLGSQALEAEVYTLISLRKGKDGSRILSTVQRYGSDLEDVVIVKNPDGSLSLAGTEEEIKNQEIWEAIRPILEENPGMSDSEIASAVRRRYANVRSALRWASENDHCARAGEGRPNAPYIYCVVS